MSNPNLDAQLKDVADQIAESVNPEDPRLEIAYAIARYLKLDWPAAYEEAKSHE